MNMERKFGIIDTTRSYTVERDVYGTDPEYAGWSVVEHCPVNGTEPWATIHPTYAEARAELESFFSRD
jgi:hypothetical protein